MIDFNEFADQLQQEVVTDIAEAYFDKRKSLDDRIGTFHQMVLEFRELEPKLSQAVARLHRLLLDPQMAKDFYIALDILPTCIPHTDEIARPFFSSLPFAFTGRGRYERCLFKAYETLQQTADEYVNGRYYADPEMKGRKKLTVHYLRLKALAEYINAEVERVNNRLSPSGTLRYVKGMDTEQIERERLIGEVCLLEGCSLDKDLQFKPIDFDSLNLLVVQDLPRLDEVKAAIRLFCKEVYRTRRQDIQHALAILCGVEN